MHPQVHLFCVPGAESLRIGSIINLCHSLINIQSLGIWSLFSFTPASLTMYLTGMETSLMIIHDAAGVAASAAEVVAFPLRNGLEPF